MDEIKFEHKVGDGRFGKVYRGTIKGVVIAIKILDKKNLIESKIDWKKEVNILKKLNSPQIIMFIKYLEDEKNIYHIFEYVPKDLFTVIKNKISEKRALKYLKNIALGVKYLHIIGIIHRDLKPENILVNSVNNIKICDFGYASFFNEIVDNFVGTIFYLAPEIIRREHSDHRIDIWALGILYFEMIKQCPPFFSENEKEIIRSILYSEIPFSPEFSNEARIRISNLLSHIPNNRPTIEEILSW